MRNIMTVMAIAVGLFTFIGTAGADGYTNGYVKRDGTVVQGYMHSDRDGNAYNNFSTKGNTNPYTGQPGTKDPYSTPSSSYSNPYGQTQSKSPYDPN